MSEFEIQAILSLGEVDGKLLSARKRLARAPNLAAPQRERVRMAREELERLASEGKRGKREVTSLEGEAKDKSAAIEKALIALNSAKSNDEYQTHLRTIDARKAELSELEDRILLAYEAQEERDAQTVAGKQRLATQERELAEAEQRVAAEEAKVQAEVEELASQRAAAAQRVSEEHLAHYERILEKTEDSAIAEVVDEHCQGCYLKVRPDQGSKVRGGKELVSCWTCGRILYGGVRTG